jgi:hypothetical protein
MERVMKGSLLRNIPLMDLESHHCREVTGTDDDGLALFCGQPKSGRTSYCPQHRRINLVMVVQAPRIRGGRHFIQPHGEERPKDASRIMGPPPSFETGAAHPPQDEG